MNQRTEAILMLVAAAGVAMPVVMPRARGIPPACGTSATSIASRQYDVGMQAYYYCEAYNSTFGNDSLVCATIVQALGMSEHIVGRSKSTSPSICTIPLDGTDTQGIDFWKPTLAPSNLFPSEYKILFQDGTGSTHTGKILGITQTNGTPNYGSSVALQTFGAGSLTNYGQFYRTALASAGVPPPTISLSIAGTAGSDATAGYDAKLDCSPPQCAPMPGGEFGLGGPFGPFIDLRMGAARSVLASRVGTDYEFIVYNGDSRARPGDMHDDPDDVMITRTYEQGDYCVAVSDHDLVNDKTSDIPDENYRNGLLAVHPGYVLCTSGDAPIEDLSLRVGTPDRMAVISIRKNDPYQIKFVSFRVVAPGTSLPPTGEPLATPSFASSCGTDSVLLTVIAYPGQNPPSGSLSVFADLSALGLAAPTPFVDDGTNGDAVAGDGTYSMTVTVPGGTVPGHLRLPFTVSDNQGRSVSEYIHLDIDPCVPVCPPCAADYNQDGGVDGADVGFFFDDWSNGIGCADVNLDGGIDGADVEQFFFAWESGDPNCGP